MRAARQCKARKPLFRERFFLCTAPAAAPPLLYPMRMDDRVTDLEIRLTHLEAAIDELTQTVLRQQQALEAAADSLEFVKSMLSDLSPGAVGPLSEETPPPHY